MYIQTEVDHLTRLTVDGMDGFAEFSDNNVAQVTAKDGELLIERFDHITEHND